MDISITTPGVLKYYFELMASKCMQAGAIYPHSLDDRKTDMQAPTHSHHIRIILQGAGACASFPPCCICMMVLMLVRSIYMHLDWPTF